MSHHQDAGRLAKEDLVYSKKHIIHEEYDDGAFDRDESQRLFEDDVIHVQTNNNHPGAQQIETGHFPTGHLKQHTQQQDQFDMAKYKQNNEQLQQILMQLQPKSVLKQHFTNSAFSVESQYAPFNRAPPIMVNPIHKQQSSNESSGVQYYKINKDNSILELAKMQNSNGTSSDAYQNQSAIHIDFLQNNTQHQISRDQSPIDRSNFYGGGQYDFLSQHNPPSTLLNSESIYQQQYYPAQVVQQFQAPPLQSKPTPKYNMMVQIPPVAQPAPQQVSALPEDKENVNLYQMMNAQPHSRTANDPFLIVQGKPQQQMEMKPQLSKTDFYKDAHKKRELMERFDDIPIKELHKADGYQQPEQQQNADEDISEENALTLVQRLVHQKWKIRMRAYKQIGELFYAEYSKECVKQDFNQNPLTEDEQSASPFEIYQQYLEKIISDTNLAAQYEGLNCLHAFARFAPDIKQMIFLVQGILLEKIQHNKPNLKEITTKILLTMIRRDKSQSLNPELIRRFRNKNIKIACFSIEVAVEALRNQLLSDDATLRQLFKALSDNVGHTNKELRTLSSSSLS